MEKRGIRPLKKLTKVVGYPAFFFWALHPKRKRKNKSQAYFLGWSLEKTTQVITFFTFSQYPAFWGGRNVTSTTDAVYLGVTRGTNTPSRISLWWLWVLSSSIDSLLAVTNKRATQWNIPGCYGSNDDWFFSKSWAFLWGSLWGTLRSTMLVWFGGSGVGRCEGSFWVTQTRGFQIMFTKAAKDGGDISQLWSSKKLSSIWWRANSLHTRMAWKVMAFAATTFGACGREEFGVARVIYLRVTMKTEGERLAQVPGNGGFYIASNRTTWYCGSPVVEEQLARCCFDLTTAEPVNYFSNLVRSFWWVEVTYWVWRMRPRVSASLKETNWFIHVKISIPAIGNLWNGKQLDPSSFASLPMSWLVSFWYEDPSTAREVLAMINDIFVVASKTCFYNQMVFMWEGVAMLLFSCRLPDSLESLRCSVHPLAFAPNAVDAKFLGRSWLSTILQACPLMAYTVPFGDSHKKNVGWGRLFRPCKLQ